MIDQPTNGAEPAGPRREPLFALLIGNGLWGAGLGVAFVIGVLVLDLGRLRHLASFSPDGWIALALLTLGAVVTFASVAMGGAIMMLGGRAGQGSDKGSGKGSGAPILSPPDAAPALAARAVRKGRRR